MFNSNNGTNFTMPVVPQGSTGGFYDGFNGNNCWWLILILIIFSGNWGYGRGFGFGGYGGGQTGDNYILTTDMASLSRQISDSTSMTERKLDGVNNGLCSGFYENAQLINGLDKSIANSNYAIQNGLTQAQIAAMQNQNALQTQISQCCCDNKAALKDMQFNMSTLNNATNNMIGTNFADLNYRIATEDCTTRRTILDNTRDVIASQENGTRAILAAIQGLSDSQKDEKIATLQAQLSDARIIANNNAQTVAFQAAINDAVERLTPPCPIPAFQVNPPFTYSGCNCGCGC